MTDTFKEKWLVTLYNVPQVGFFDVLSLDRGYEPLTRIPQTGCARVHHTVGGEVSLATGDADHHVAKVVSDGFLQW